MNQDFYKELIYQGFFPSRRFSQPNFESSKKALENYRKIADSASDLVEMMLYYVEIGSDFMTEFDGIAEDTCMDLENTFEAALKQIVKDNLQNKFENQCRKIVEDANDGYGFQETLESHFDDCFK